MLDQIEKELRTDRNSDRPISGSLVRESMKSKDRDLIDATYVLLNSAHFQRIVPQLSFDEIFGFMLKYYALFLKDNPTPRGKPPMRYSAGWDLVAWFCHLWNSGTEKSYFERIKSKLADLYKSGDPDLKQAIRHAIIEHLFERKAIRKFFADWKKDPELRPAYDEGMLWVSHGGTSPLSESSEKAP